MRSRDFVAPAGGNGSALVSPTLGGSTIAAACGIDPYCSPIRLWCELTGRLSREPNEAMEWGKRLEPVVKDELRERGYHVSEVAEATVAATPWLVGHPDGFVVFRDTRETRQALLEVKCSARGYDSPPLPYLAQIQTYLYLTGCADALLATLAGLHLDVTEIERSDHQIEVLLFLAERFMRYVWDDVQPPPDGHPDDRGALVALFPNAEPRKVRETREVRDARRELALLLEREKVAKGRAEALRAVVTNYMGAADTLIDAHDAVVATWKNTTGRRLDTARFRKERPDVYDEYAQPQTTRRLLLT